MHAAVCCRVRDDIIQRNGCCSGFLYIVKNPDTTACNSPKKRLFSTSCVKEQFPLFLFSYPRHGTAIHIIIIIYYTCNCVCVCVLYVLRLDTHNMRSTGYQLKYCTYTLICLSISTHTYWTYTYTYTHTYTYKYTLYLYIYIYMYMYTYYIYTDTFILTLNSHSGAPYIHSYHSWQCHTLQHPASPIPLMTVHWFVPQEYT